MEKDSNMLFKALVYSNRDKLLPSNHPDVKLVQSIMLRLVKASRLYNVDWRIFVIDSDEKNAFILPGGKVFVFTGLLRMLPDTDSLAAVLAHETAHQVASHINEKMSRQQITAILSFLFSMFYDPSGVIAS